MKYLKIYRNPYFRKIGIAILKTINPGKITIKHSFTSRKFLLDAYLHKGYWFRGKKVEEKSMKLFSELIKPTDVVLEIGGHIGFMTHYFSELVDESGKIYVFEPGINNLPFLKANISINKYQNIVLIEKAVSDTSGSAVFYIENVTGQNNSLIPDHSGPNSHKNLKNYKEKFSALVETISLDEFLNENKIHKINFIKVDIEGAELSALKGMKNCLRLFKPRIMFEITRNHAEMFATLYDLNYVLFNENKQMLLGIKDSGNIFGMHKDDPDIKILK